MNAVAAGGIRTPDQRLRVFVSSTLKELATERRAARAAIERLALAPVMFELGARPHPPRELYRAYLEQSDIFLGIYWEQYGWIAPGEEVSGLEDEWNLAPDIPKLIYVKRSEHRQDRLDELIGRIRDDDRASYVTFEDAAELAELVTADLATLLAERFDAADPRHEPLAALPSQAASTETVGLPSPLTRLLGRDDELRAVAGMLAEEGRRLVTITGPGGIGKSRLAIAAARTAEAAFPDGVVFVDLAPVLDHRLVIAAVANALGIRDTGDRPIAEKLGRALADRRMLILLDNVEQVVEAAPELSALLAGSSVSVLATSRTLLRVGGEQSVALGPLRPADAASLFVERARAVKPDFELTEENAGAIAAICTALDNAPLALELAAARVRVLTPTDLAARLDHALPLLTGGARDLPERQRTLRATIEWSTQLLRPEERELLLRLGVFRSGFGLDAVEWIAGGLGGAGSADAVAGVDAADAGAELDAVDALAALVDGSLVREEDRGTRAWFSMLATVREYGRERLAERGALADAQERHAQFYRRLAGSAERALTWKGQVDLMSRLTDERDELRAAVEHLFATRQHDAVAELAWPLYWFWWVSGQLGEVRAWMSRLLDSDVPLSERSRIIALYCTSSIRHLQTPESAIVPALTTCAEYFRRDGDRRGESLSLVSLAIAEMTKSPPDLDDAESHLARCLALVDELGDPFGRAMVGIMSGRLAIARGRVPEAFAHFERSLAMARGIGDRLGEAIALNHLGWARLLSDDLDGARACFSEQLLISSTFGHEEGLAYGLEGMSAVAATSGDLDRSGRMLGAAETVRERKGLLTGADFSLHVPIVDRVLAGPGAAAFDAARRAGRDAALADVVELALA